MCGKEHAARARPHAEEPRVKRGVSKHEGDVRRSRLAASRVRSLIHLSNSTRFFVPAARFLRPGFATLASRTRSEGWRSAERTSGACEAPVRRVSDTPGA